MSDNDEDEHNNEVGEKRFRFEDPTPASAQSSSHFSTRWSSATPRQYGGGGAGEATPQAMRAGGGGFEGGWRGFATPSATPMGGEEVGTPRFGLDGRTPAAAGHGGRTPSQWISGATPAYGVQTPRGLTGGMFGTTPSHQFEGTTPMQSHYAPGTGGFSGPETAHTPSTVDVDEKAMQLEAAWRLKNKVLTTEFLDEYLPSAEYFEIVPPPSDYNPPPIEEPNFYEAASQELAAASAGVAESAGVPLDIPESLGPGMPEMHPNDAPVFVELLQYANKEDTIPAAALLSYMLMKNLFKIKNGDATQRRLGVRYILEKSHVFGAKLIFGKLFVVWSANILDIQQKHYIIEFCKALITQLGVAVRKSCKEVIHMMEPLLSAQEPVIREDGRQTLILLTRVAGFRTVWRIIQPDFSHTDNSVRHHTAKVVALIAVAAGLEDTIEELKKLSFSELSFCRQTAARAIGEMCSAVRHGAVSSLADIVSILERLIRDERRVAREAAVAVAVVAEVCAPFGGEELSVVVHHIFEECRKGLGNSAAPFLRAFGALLPLMPAEDARHCTAALMPVLVNQFHTPEDEYRRTLLTVVKRCITTDGISADFIREVLLEPFFSGFWKAHRVALDKRTSALLLGATVGMAKKLGSVDILVKLAGDIKDDNERFQRLVLHGVRRVVAAVGLDDAQSELCKILLEKTKSAVQQDEEGANKTAVDTFATVCNALGERLKPFLKDVFDVIHRRRESRESAIRTQAAEFTARIARTVMKADGAVFLRDLGSSIFTRMEDDDPVTLSANLRATRILLEVLGSKYSPSVKELLKKLTHVIKNGANGVQQNAVALIELIATDYYEEVDPIHLYQLATRGLFDLLDAERRETRQICARTFGVIALKISPFAIILELVDNFRQDKRKIRICTAVALGAIAKRCGPFTVLPYILNEFQISENEQVAVIVQHAVLKAIRYIFEAIGHGGEDYVWCCLPLLQRALTETSIQMRRMAIEASRALLMSVAGLDGFAGVATHLMNFIHPNIVELLSKKETKVGEERLKLISSVVSFYEAARLHVGSGVMYSYLAQGLFHPARLVRDIYRRAYNMLYIASPEQLVPYYPLIENGTEFPADAVDALGGREAGVKRFYRYEIQVPF